MTLAGRRSAGDRIFDACNAALMALFCVTILYPIWQEIVVSLSTVAGATELGPKLFPHPISLASYRLIFSTSTLGIAYLNTVLRTVVGTAITVFFKMCMAYGLAKKRLPFRNAVTTMMLVTMFFSGGLIPTYFLIRTLGIYDTFWALVIPGMLDAYTIFIARNFVMGLPESLEESAIIDGANEMRVFFQIIIPLCAPIIATVALWAAVGHWNAWFDALVYTRKRELLTLQLLLRQMLIATQNSVFVEAMGGTDNYAINRETYNAATIMVTIGPIILAYPFAQRFFIKGIMIGSLKG
jgi:putative aldouronate transport system permease protein